MTEKILKQGAEGRLYIGDWMENRCLVKERFVKKYRHPDLDQQITRQRIKAEVKGISRCASAGILTPKVYNSDLNERKIYMEYLENAITAKQYIHHIILNHRSEELLDVFCKRLGKIIGIMHFNHIIHGDLTTSNILINPKDPNDKDVIEYDMILIDFGLSQYSQSVEDKGVDLYVLERALLSTHSELPYLFEKILQSYRLEQGTDGQQIVSKFEEVRARGRKRTMIG